MLWFYPQFHCKIYGWRWCELNLIFFQVVSSFGFSDEKRIQISKFCPCGFWLPQIVNKILRFCSWYRLWHLTDFCLNNNIYSTHIFLEITTFISIWFQLSHNGSSKLIKIFIKSFCFGILGYLYGFFKKNCINCEYQYLWNHLKVKFSGVSNFIYLNRCKKFRQNLRGSTGELLKNLLTWHGMSQDKNIKI